MRFVPNLALSLLLACALTPLAAVAETAQGVVYEDLNENGRRDAGEPGLPKVAVSNGADVLLTDAEGKYALELEGDGEIFVIKPAGYMTPLTGDMIPAFHYVHRPNGSPSLKFAGVPPTGPLPKSIDFPLRRQSEPTRFDMILFGDTQPRDVTEVNYLAHDVFEEVAALDASFGVTLGDVVFDDLDVFGPLKDAMSCMGLPWYNVFGNHDVNKDVPGDAGSNETFIREYTPAYYAFNYGKVHFIALDDIAWEGDGYHAELGPRQLEFVKNDLAQVPDEMLVVPMMHIPLPELRDLPQLFALIQDRPHTLSLSAHTHNQRHEFLGEAQGWHGEKPHHHIVHVTACGSWMNGVLDERGIPHAMMSDGGPNGYSIVTFDGTGYSVDFRPASRPATWQMNVYSPDELPVGRVTGAEVLVNVFAGSERSVTRMRVGGGEWIPMERVQRADPAFEAWKVREEVLHESLGRKLPKPQVNGHMWAARLNEELPPGGHLILVESKDMFGKTHYGRRIIRVTE